MARSILGQNLNGESSQEKGEGEVPREKFPVPRMFL